MRLLLVSDHYPPFIGGAHRQTHTLARHMVSRGHEVTVVTSWHGGLPTSEDLDGVDVRRVRQLRTAVPALVRDRSQRHQPPFPDPVTVRSLRRILNETKPDLVHVHGWMASSVSTALIGRKIPLLVSARGYGSICATGNLLHEGLPCSGPSPVKCVRCASTYYGPVKGVVSVASVAGMRPLIVRKMTALHSVSTYVHDVMVDHLLGGEDSNDARRVVAVTVPSVLASEGVPNGVRVEKYLERLPGEPFILFVGAFRPPKGLQILFEAYRRLVSPPPLVLMGTFKRDSPESFPPGVIVLTDVPHAAVMAAWDRAMFGVMPSLWPEPFGTVVVEGMSRGRPVIGSRTGGHADIIDELSGVLVPQGNVDALVEAMQLLIDDPARRAAMGRAARDRAQLFVAETVLPRFEQLYSEILAREQVPYRHGSESDQLSRPMESGRVSAGLSAPKHGLRRMWVR